MCLFHFQVPIFPFFLQKTKIHFAERAITGAQVLHRSYRGPPNGSPQQVSESQGFIYKHWKLT